MSEIFVPAGKDKPQPVMPGGAPMNRAARRRAARRAGHRGAKAVSAGHGATWAEAVAKVNEAARQREEWEKRQEATKAMQSAVRLRQAGFVLPGER